MKKISGTITAIICPFSNGNVDYQSLESLISAQVKSGVRGFVVHGTTGESPTISKSEKKEIFSFIKQRVPTDFLLIVGTGTNSTSESIENSKEAEVWGADALLLVVPYYNKPPQRGLIEHFKAIASAVNIPCLLYNVPGRTVARLEVETVKELSKHPNIVGIKEASGDIDFAKRIRLACGENFILLSGDDGTYDEFMKAGGNGVISVASHIIPKAFSDLNVTKYRELVDFLFIEANPIPVKYALASLRVIATPECRLPLVELATEHQEKMKLLLSKYGVTP